MAKQTASKVPVIRFKKFEGDWKRAPLVSVCNLLTGNPFESKKFSKSGVFLVRGMNVKRGYLDMSANISEYWPSSSGLENFLLEEDDIVIQMDGALIGKSYAKITKEQLPALLVQRVTRVRCENMASSDFLYQYIQRDFLRYIQKSKTETAVPHLSLEDIRNFSVAVPSSAEQFHIGEYFRELDSLICLHQRKHDKLVALKKAMLQKMFPHPGVTTPEIRFKGFLGDWEQRPLKTLASKVTEKNVSIDHSETFTNSAEFGVVSQRDYFDKDISNADNLGGYYIVEPECFVYNPRISVLAPVGPINRNKLGRTGVMSPLYTVLRTKDVDNTFLEYFFKTNLWHPFMFLNGDTGARADRFSIKDAVFMELPVPYPVLTEQQKIGNYFRTLDELIFKHATQLQKLQQIKSACLEKMFV